MENKDGILFERNKEDRVVFLWVGIASFALCVVFAILFIFEIIDNSYIKLIPMSFLCGILYIYPWHSLKHSFFKITDTHFEVINSNNRNFKYEIKDVEKIILPNEAVLQKRFANKNVIIKIKDISLSISYTEKLYSYLKENFSPLITYYDKYAKAIKNL